MTLVLAIGLVGTSNPKNIEYYDNSCRVAEPELISLVDGVAQEIGYLGDYEIVEPTSTGLLLSPWNRLMYARVNPVDQNNLILINKGWFVALSLDEQRFLVARYLIKLQLGEKSLLMRLLPWICGLLSLLILVLLIFCLNRTVFFRSKHFLINLLVSFGICVCLETLILDKLNVSVLKYAAFRFDCKLNQLALEKLPNKVAAIGALKAFDQAIKAGIADGHNLFKEHENTFANLAKELEQ